jgi:hypothetical protein
MTPHRARVVRRAAGTLALAAVVGGLLVLARHTALRAHRPAPLAVVELGTAGDTAAVAHAYRFRNAPRRYRGRTFFIVPVTDSLRIQLLRDPRIVQVSHDAAPRG